MLRRKQMTEKEVNKTVGVVMASLLPQNEKRELIDSIRAMEKETKNNGWIRSEDQMPEDDEDVLVWFEYFRFGEYQRLFQTTGIGRTWRGEWSEFVNGSSGWRDLKIIAWQPLPEPYREEQEDE